MLVLEDFKSFSLWCFLKCTKPFSPSKVKLEVDCHTYSPKTSLASYEEYCFPLFDFQFYSVAETLSCSKKGEFLSMEGLHTD